MVNKYSADATRLSLIIGTGPGNDMKLSEDKVRGYKNFGNKIWNITRFILASCSTADLISDFNDYEKCDDEIREERDNLLIDITSDMDNYRYYLAGEKLYHYIWHNFADKVLEDSKKIFESDNEKQKKSRKQILLHTLDKMLRALHPFMPYVTEEIWQEIKKGKSLLMIEKWPI